MLDSAERARENGRVPRYARPANGEYAEDPINALGNAMQATIIGHLRSHPGLTRGEIAEALELNKMTVANGLEKLIDAGLLLADPPRRYPATAGVTPAHRGEGRQPCRCAS